MNPFKKQFVPFEKPFSYYCIKAVVRHMPCGTRRKCAAKLLAIRKVDARIPITYYSVELSFEKATNCTRLLIDNLVIKFHFKKDQPDKILVETWKKSIELPKQGLMEKCVKHYLMKPNVEIRNLTISRTRWPSNDFFPFTIRSLLLISTQGMENSLRFPNISVDRVIIRNEYKHSQIFNIPMVHSAEKVFATSIETMNAAILDYPMRNATIRELITAEESFFMFCDKMKTGSEESIGSSFTATFLNEKHCKTLWKQLKRRYETKKTTWEGKKCLTIAMEAVGELVISHEKSGSISWPKIHYTIHALPKDSSVERNASTNLVGRWRAHLHI